jgi:hypothetical protein
MSPEVGSRVIEIARGLIGSHYINGAYGATPGRDDGCPCRPGGVKLVADPNRLNPSKLTDATKNLAVFAAEMTIKKYCVCAGNYSSFLGAPKVEVAPTDGGLVGYLASLKGKPTAMWPKYQTDLTPRRAFGPGPGGDLGGRLVWGQSCKGMRHFDCVGFISYCYWKATGAVVQLDISAWRTPNMAGTVFDLKAGKFPPDLMDGDILVKADHHIAFVDAKGTIFEAQDTHLGVLSSGGFSLKAPGAWTHLVRLASGADTPAREWPLGWWKVRDGNTYFYFFGPNGVVKSTKTSPPNTRMPPSHANNEGRYTNTAPNRLVITWNKVAGAATSCQETFYNAAAGCEEMNATSNLYSPLVATWLV